ncbi:MAG: ketopantoate reductase family protein, partial [Vibrio sp.]
PIILCHNGMGSIDGIKDQLKDYQIYLASTTQAAFKPSTYQVKHTGQGQTLIGSLNPRPVAPFEQIWLNALGNALPHVCWQDDIYPALWTKLAINAVINPLTAIHQCKNGELTRYPNEVNQTLSEVNRIIESQSLKINTHELSQRVWQIIESTAQNYSSMHQDLAHQRQSEIDYINGYLVKVAKQAKIHAPFLQGLVEKVKQLEQTKI